MVGRGAIPTSSGPTLPRVPVVYAPGPVPPSILDIASLSRSESRRTSTGEALGLLADISGPGGLSHLRVHHERLPAGRRSSPMHAHSAREEVVFVLSGRVELVTPSARLPLAEGQCACLPAGGPPHSIENAGESVAELLVVSASPGEDVVTLAD